MGIERESQKFGRSNGQTCLSVKTHFPDVLSIELESISCTENPLTPFESWHVWKLGLWLCLLACLILSPLLDLWLLRVGFYFLGRCLQLVSCSASEFHPLLLSKLGFTFLLAAVGQIFAVPTCLPV